MADRRDDLEMEPLLPQTTDRTAEVSFTFPTFEDNTQYNTDANLSSDPSFAPPADVSLIGQQLNYAHIADQLKNALEGTGWYYTNNGLTKLSPRIHSEGNKLFYVPEIWEINAMTEKEKLEKRLNTDGVTFTYILPLTKPNGKFYSANTLMKYGEKIINQIKKVIDTASEDEENHTDKIQKRLEDLRGLSGDFLETEAKVDDAETIRGFQPKDNSLIENILDSPKPIERLIDATDDELKSLGLSDNALRELRGLKQAGDALATVKRDKDMKIEELEKQLADLKEELLNTAGDNFVDKTRLEKEIEELQDKLIIEHKKVFDLDNDRETKIKRLKRLITDVLKNPDSRISLKDRLKLLFKLEGFTIAAVIATITMFFSTIGLAISNSLRGSSGGGGGSGGGDKPPSIPDRVREGLKKLAEWLKELAKKSVLALPGFIGSIVSFLLKSAGAVIGFLAEHLIILIFIVVSSVVYGLIEGVKTIKKSYK